jgi:hypothetical protein
VSTGGDNVFEIKYRVDDSDARAKFAAGDAALDRTTARASNSARKVADAHAKAAQTQFVSLGKVQAAGIKYQDDLARAAQKSADKQAEAAKKAADAAIREAERAAAAQGKAAEGQADSLKNLALGWASLGTAQKVLDFFYERFHAMRADITESVKDLEGFRKSVLGLAALNDRLGNTTAETRANLEFRQKTLQGREEATQFQEGILNTGQAAIGRKIAREEFDRLAVKGGAFQAAVGGPAETHGEFLGALPSLMKTANGQLLKAEDVFAKQQQVFDILQKGGSSLSSGAGQLLKNSSLTAAGLYRDIAQQAALQSAFSLKAPESAGTLVDQFTRATVGALGKMRGSGVEGDEKQAEYLRGLGATDQMDPVQIGRLISADIARQQREDATRGLTTNPYAYLGHHGFVDQETKMALMQFHALNTPDARGLSEYGVFEGLAAARPTAAGAEQKIREFQAVDPAAAAQRNKLAEDAAKAAQGAGAPEYYQHLKELAANRLLARGEIYGEGKTGRELVEYWESGMLNYISGTGSAQIAEEARKILEEQATAAGVKTTKTGYTRGAGGQAVAGEVPILGYSHYGQTEEERARTFYEFAGQVAGKGGSPNAGIDQLIAVAKKQLESTERQEKLMREGQKAPVGPLAPARPGPGWTR